MFYVDIILQRSLFFLILKYIDVRLIYITTKEIAHLLRLGECNVYDLGSNGDMPCVRKFEKLIFPQDTIH